MEFSFIFEFTIAMDKRCQLTIRRNILCLKIKKSENYHETGNMNFQRTKRR
jgi:hypothetical protein